MNFPLINTPPPKRAVSSVPRSSGFRHRLAAIPVGLSAAFVAAGRAFAAAASSPTGGLGEQLNTMSSEAINAGGTFFGMSCYLAAAVCFGLGVWALWQSRQPQNRETGFIGRGLAGLVLCGLFATAGVWINKASVSTSGSSASINDSPAMVQFGTSG